MSDSGKEEQGRGLAALLDRCLPQYAECLTHRAWLMILVCTLVFAGFLGHMAANPITVSAGAGFNVRGAEEADNLSALEAGFRVTEFDPQGAVTSATVFPKQSQPASSLLILFEKGEDVDTIFNEQSLKRALNLVNTVKTFQGRRVDSDGERTITEPMADYCLIRNGTCAEPTSVLSFFFSDLDDASSLTSDIDAAAQALASSMDPMVAGLRAQLVSNDFTVDNPKAEVMGVAVSYGFPLTGYNNHIFEFDDQTDQLKDWGFDLFEFLNSEFNKDDDTTQVLYQGSFLVEYETDSLIINAVQFAAFSFLAVFFYMLFHTRSGFLTVFGLVHILMSFPGAYFFYRGIIGIKSFEFFNFLALFVILGIGADDVFILLDTAKQSGSEKHLVHSTKARMQYTMRRSILAMSVSSFTTAAAFFANSLSSIPTIQFFGVFAGLLVVVNFILVITWFPAFVVLHWRKQRYGWRSLFMSRTKAKALAKQANADKAGSHNEVKDLRRLERFFRDTYSVFVFKNRRYILAFFLVFFSVSLIGALQIAPAQDTSQFLDDETNLQRTVTHLTESFATSTFNVKLHLSMGIQPMGYDTSEVDPLDLNDEGTVIWDTDFDPSPENAQLFIIDTCDQLAAMASDIQQMSDSVLCGMKDLRDYRANVVNATFPIPQAEFFDAALNYTRWRTLQGGGSGGGAGFGPPGGEGVLDDFRATFRYDNPDFADAGKGVQLRFMDIVANMTYSLTSPASKLRPAYDRIAAFADKRNAASKTAGLQVQSAFPSAVKFVNMATEEALVRIALYGVFLSLGVVMIVIFISTGFSFIVAGLATLCVGGVTASFIAFMVALGWELGLIESVNVTVSVGLAVDYIVHFANAFTESQLVAGPQHTEADKLIPGMTLTLTEAGRFLRLRQAMVHMGISVFSSFVTSVASASFLGFALVIVFQRFGIFIVAVITMSCFYAFFAFFALMAEFGPIKNTVDATKATEMTDVAAPVGDTAA